MRRKAESGSPWLPVEMATTLSSGNDSISRGEISIPSGAAAIPRFRAMLKFFRIERPTSATLRSSWAAAHSGVNVAATVESDQPANVAQQAHFSRGDVAKGFAESDVVLDRTYRI